MFVSDKRGSGNSVLFWLSNGIVVIFVEIFYISNKSHDQKNANTQSTNFDKSPMGHAHLRNQFELKTRFSKAMVI